MARQVTRVSGEAITNELTITVEGTLDILGPVDTTVTVSLAAAPPTPTPTPPPPTTTPLPTPTPTPPPTTTPLPTPTPTPPPTGGLSVELTAGGATFTFRQADGLDLGDYVEPNGHFTQRCIVASNPELSAFRVFFRPDADGRRDEVVFELGALFAPDGIVPTNFPTYSVVIKRGSTVLASINAPVGHYWNSRWRWQSAPRPVIYPAQELISDGVFPPYSETLFGSKIPLSTPRAYTNPMDLAGITPYIPSTGERDEIGVCTEAQAEYLCLGSAASLASLRAQLEGSGTIPWHFRDENTFAPIDVNAYPNATMYGSTGNPLIKNPTSPITLDVAHEGSFAFVPFMLTGDPYALEEMQFYTTYNIIMQPPSARQNWNLGNAVRAVAWSLRALMHNATFTPPKVPGWLMPRSYFADMLAAERSWFMSRFVSSTTPPANTLGLVSDGAGAPAAPPIPANCYASVWMEDFLSAVLAWVVRVGHEDWRPILDWKMHDLLGRTNGTSGWVRAIPSMYTMVIRTAANTPIAANWASCWQFNVQIQPDKCIYVEKNTIPANLDPTYPSYAMGALALAASVNAMGAQAAYDWLLEQLQAKPQYIRRKWAIASPLVV